MNKPKSSLKYGSNIKHFIKTELMPKANIWTMDHAGLDPKKISDYVFRHTVLMPFFFLLYNILYQAVLHLN